MSDMFKLTQLRDTPYWLNFVFTGQMYKATARFPITTPATPYIISILTPANKIIHIVELNAAFTGGGPMVINGYEAPTITHGVAITPKNQNRLSAKTSGMAIYGASTSRVGGTLFAVNYIPSSGVATSINNFIGTQFEILLKKSTIYALEVFNEDTTDTDFFLEVTYYESGN